MSGPSFPILEVEDLNVRLDGGRVHAVADLDLRLSRSEILGIAGESGAGKTQAMLALLGLAGGGEGAETSGRVTFDGEEFDAGDHQGIAGLRGAGLAMVTQESMASLTPVVRVGVLLEETLQAHRARGGGSSRSPRSLLTEVGFSEPDRVLQSFSHQLSGGMRQRVSIALALAADPQVLIADEPTTALDLTVQVGIMALLSKLRADRGMSIILLSHDLAVIAQLTDRTTIMRGGRVVEAGPTDRLFASPENAYTSELLDRLRARRTVLDPA